MRISLSLSLSHTHTHTHTHTQLSNGVFVSLVQDECSNSHHVLEFPALEGTFTVNNRDIPFNETVLTCGTNAFNPQCHYRNVCKTLRLREIECYVTTSFLLLFLPLHLLLLLPFLLPLPLLSTADNTWVSPQLLWCQLLPLHPKLSHQSPPLRWVSKTHYIHTEGRIHISVVMILAPSDSIKTIWIYIYSR